jgi:hypothetical protein
VIRFAWVLLLLQGCRGVATTTDAGACTRVGDSCTYAAGKLGLCVELEHDAGPPTLICQSQH